MHRAAHRLRRGLAVAVSAAVLGSGAVALDVRPASAAYRVPPTPAGLTASIEANQPYVGQSTCDPKAKPGVAAFRDLLLRTYPSSGSFGISRDCGAGGQSEHKEGRAFDWKVSAYNTQQKGEADALIAWLLKTDQHGNAAAMARRFGIMYMIWNKRIWKSYDATWRAYSGPSPHTDHVHFSFGWNGAKKRTSYWDGTVAQLDFGPRLSPRVYPVRTLSNLSVLRTYGDTYLSNYSSGPAVTFLQKRLGVEADGDYGSGTATAVAHFQVDQRLEPTQRFGPADWRAMFPLPQNPIGAIDPPGYALGNLLVRGWALDLDTSAPVQVTATVDGGPPQSVTANLPHDGVRRDYPEWGDQHGYAFVLPVTVGSHTVCLTAVNAAQTPGTNTTLGCRTMTAQHSPVGALEVLTPGLGTVTVGGWALDPDTADTVTTGLTVDGVPSEQVLTTTSRPDIDARYPGMGDQHGVEAELALTEGTHRVCLTAANASGTPGQNAVVGCRTITFTHSPVAGLDIARQAPGGLLVSGWALDPDVTDASTVEVLSNGVVVASMPATAYRSALATSWPAHGTGHGFSKLIDLPAGTSSVCLRVHNAEGTPGGDVTLACRQVRISHDPAGVVTANRTIRGGSVLVTGEAYDPNTYDRSAVTVSVNGKAVRTLTADDYSTARWVGYGPWHRFKTTLELKAGKHTICVRAENVAGTPGTARSLGCRRVVVSNGIGKVTSWSRSGRILTVRGWTLDPDSSKSNKATLVVDRKPVRTVLASRTRNSLTTLAPGYGTQHGFVLKVTLSRGWHKVCVASRNLSGTPGRFGSAGCRTYYIR
jgi:peptidoglycan hydrolase-like protein with peptidoglycan-binding domain